VSLLLETTIGRGELEGPKEVVGSLEVRADGHNLMDQVFDGVDANLSETLLNDGVVIQRNSGTVDLAVTALVDKSADGVTRGISVGDQRLNGTDHVDGGLVEADEDAIVELAETQEAHDALLLGGKLVDTKVGSSENFGVSYAGQIGVLLTHEF